MGIFDFLKDAGDKKVSTKSGMSDEEMQELKTGNNVARHIISSSLEVQDLDVDFDDGVVTLKGRVPDQTTREKVVLMAGNTIGVARVDDQLQVIGEGGTDQFGNRLYTVKKGDTLSAIAGEKLGNASRWKEIFEANRPMLEDPDKIYPGQVLRIPEK